MLFRIFSLVPRNLLPSNMPRSALKTITYSLMHLTVAFLVAFALTRSWQAALAIGLIEPAVQTIAYAGHEKIWSRFEKPNLAK